MSRKRSRIEIDIPQPRSVALRSRGGPREVMNLVPEPKIETITIPDEPAVIKSWRTFFYELFGVIDWGAWYRSNKRPLRTNVRERLVLYYEAQLTGLITHKASTGYLSEHAPDPCAGTNRLDKDINTLFTLYNLNPILGHPINYVIADVIELVLDPSWVYQRGDGFTISIAGLSPARRIHEYNQLGRIWNRVRVLAESLDTAPNVFIFGHAGGRFHTGTAWDGHAIAYTIDLKLKRFELFDVNGNDFPTQFSEIRNFLADALINAGFTPQPGLEAPTEVKNKNPRFSPAMVNQTAIRHPGTCGLWSGFYLWMRTINPVINMRKLFDAISGSADAQRALNSFVTDMFLCSYHLFNACRIDLFKYSGLAEREAVKLHKQLQTLGSQNLYGNQNQPLINAALRVVFGCYKPNMVRTALQECSPYTADVITVMFRDNSIRLPWRYHIGPRAPEHSNLWGRSQNRREMLAARNVLAITDNPWLLKDADEPRDQF